MNLPKAIFFTVQSAQDKVKKIFQTAKEHFGKKEPFLLLVPDMAAATFIDEWLWKMEETSFLPHTITEESSEELIVISPLQAPHERHFLFNLCSPPPQFHEKIKIVYEFDDSSSPLKSELSKKKFSFYREKDFLIELR
jgi:DNA polymerase IIIc chi subunit